MQLKGRWTDEEHELFLEGLKLYGKGWKKIALHIKSRSVVQVRTHAQKYFLKVAKAKQSGVLGDVPMGSKCSSNASSAPTKKVLIFNFTFCKIVTLLDISYLTSVQHMKKNRRFRSLNQKIFPPIFLQENLKTP